MNFPATYETLMYSEYRPDLVDMLNYTKSAYDRARNLQKSKYELITFFRVDCRISESDVECFHRGSYIANCFKYLKSKNLGFLQRFPFWINMTEAMFEIGKQILDEIEKHESLVTSIERMKSHTSSENFRGQIISMPNGDSSSCETGCITFTKSDIKLFCEILDKMSESENNIIASLKKQFKEL